MRVLVTDCDDRKALAAVRALGRRGVHVLAGGSSHLDQGLHSRFCSERVLYPSPRINYGRFASRFLAFLQAGRAEVLLPMSDYTATFAARRQKELRPCVALAVPDFDALSAVSDKARLPTLAREAKVLVPRTHAPADEDEVRELVRRIEYPCVLKPRRSAGAVGVSYPECPEELLARWPASSGRSDEVYCYDRPLVQEFVPGPVHSIGVLFDRGRPIAGVTQRHIRNVPLTGGRCVEVVTTDVPEVRSAAYRLLAGLGWHGPALLQFKEDERDGRLKLLDVNGRFWGTLGTAVEAGVDFPWLACRIALGERVEPVGGYQVGLRYRWFVPYEFMHLCQSPRPLAALRNLFARAPDRRSDIRADDPGPLLSETLRCVVGLLAKTASRFGRQ